MYIFAELTTDVTKVLTCIKKSKSKKFKNKKIAAGWGG